MNVPLGIKQSYEFFKKHLSPPRFGELSFHSLSTIADIIIKIGKPNTILEIGFNRGSSALTFLLLSDCELVSVDKNKNLESINLLSSVFPGRFMFIESPSSILVGVENWNNIFDLVFIDGDHSYQSIREDTINVLKFNPKYILYDDWFHGAHRNDLLKIVEEFKDRLELISEYVTDCGQALFKIKNKKNNTVLEKIHITKYGKFLLGNDDVSNAFFQNGEEFFWDAQLKSYYDKFLKKETSVCIDVGANIGAHTVYLGQKAKKVYAFEPQRFIYHQLCGNIFINGLLNVECYNLACYEKECSLNLTEGTPDYLSKHISAGLGYYINDSPDENSVAAIRLDDFITEKIDLIKIDAQGSDYRILLGAIHSIKKYRPIVLFEIEAPHLLAPHNHEKDDYFSFFKNLGYRVESAANNPKAADWAAIPNEL